MRAGTSDSVRSGCRDLGESVREGVSGDSGNLGAAARRVCRDKGASVRAGAAGARPGWAAASRTRRFW